VRLVSAFARHWLFVLNLVVFLYLFGAFLAPLMLAARQEWIGGVLYTAYGFTCHQLPERSFFLGAPDGPMRTYNRDVLIHSGADADTLWNYRAYRGNAALGYKVAISDRMVAMYGGALLAGLLYALLHRLGVQTPLPAWTLLVFVLPMAVDGTTHLIDDLTGIGWRATNAWALPLFGPGMGPNFYTGTNWGSLNSILRLVTGVLFGAGVILVAYPLIRVGFEDLAGRTEDRSVGDDRR